MDQETALEERKRIVTEAEWYDRLVTEPGWTKVLHLMAERVDRTITDATNPPENGEGVLANAFAKTIQVTRWDAQRELLDVAQNHIKFIRQERDRIKEEERIMEHGGQEVNG